MVEPMQKQAKMRPRHNSPSQLLLLLLLRGNKKMKMKRGGGGTVANLAAPSLHLMSYHFLSNICRLTRQGLWIRQIL
jgi:hypothetical protein